MEQTRGSSDEFHLHRGVKQDLTEEITFGIWGQGVGRAEYWTSGTRRRIDSVYSLQFMTPRLFCFFPFIPIHYSHIPLSRKLSLCGVQYLSSNIYASLLNLPCYFVFIHFLTYTNGIMLSIYFCFVLFFSTLFLRPISNSVHDI